MLILAAKHELAMLRSVQKVITETIPNAKVTAFSLSDAALQKQELWHDIASPVPDKLRVQCFGYFEVYWQGKPLIFARRQAKELFAFLIDREGTACTAEEAVTALWEGETDIRAAKHRLRTILADLRHTLRGIGMEDVLIRERRQMAVRRDMLECDYYRFLDGDETARGVFRGDYMQAYSWAEPTRGKLYFHRQE